MKFSIREVESHRRHPLTGGVLPTTYRLSVAPSTTSLPEQAAGSATEGFAGATEAARTLPEAERTALLDAASSAFTAAYQYSMLTAAGLALGAGGALAWRLGASRTVTAEEVDAPA